MAADIVYDERKLAGLAGAVNEHMFEAHRGAFLLPPKILPLAEGHDLPRGRRLALAFGNDGHTKDERTRKLVELLRGRLSAAGFEAGPTVVEDDGCTWIIPVAVDEGRHTRRDMRPAEEAAADLIESLVWECWAAAWGVPLDSAYAAIQRDIALVAVGNL